jgi:hypothetical protein
MKWQTGSRPGQRRFGGVLSQLRSYHPTRIVVAIIEDQNGLSSTRPSMTIPWGAVSVFELQGHPTAHLYYALIRRLSDSWG